MPPRPRPSRKQRKNNLQFQVVRDENGEVALRCLNPPKGVRTREQLLPYVSPNIPLDMIEDTRRQTRFSRETLEDDQDSALVERLLQNISLEDLDFGDNGHDDFDAYDNFDDDDIDVIDMHELEATEHDAHSRKNHKLFGAQSNTDAYTYDYNRHFRPFSENGAFVVPGVGITSDPQADQPIVPAAPDVDDTFEEDLKTDAGLQKRQKKIQSKIKGTVLSSASGLELPIFESSGYKFTDDFLAPLETGETELYEEIEDNIFELLMGNSDDDSVDEEEPSEYLSREDVLRQLQSQNEETESPVSIAPSRKELGPIQPSKGKKGVQFTNQVTNSTTTTTTQSKAFAFAPVIHGTSLGAWSDEENDDENKSADFFDYGDDDGDYSLNEDEDDLYEDDDEFDQDAQVDREIMSRMKQRLMKNYKPEDGVSIEIEEGEFDEEDDFADGEGEFEDLSWYFESQQEGDYDDEGRNIYEDDNEFAPIENDPYYKGAMLVQFNKLMDEYENDNSTDDDEFERPYDEDDAELQFHINKDGVSIDDQGVRTAIAEFDGRNRNTQFNYRNLSKTIAPEVTQFTKDWVDSQQNTPQPSLAQVEKDIDRQFAKKKKERLDVQSMRTTLSTTTNIPTLIKEVRIRAPTKAPSQKRSQGPISAPVTKKGNAMDADYVPTPIKLDAMGVPLGVMEKHREDRKNKGAAKSASSAQEFDSQLAEDQEEDEDDENDEDDEGDEEHIPGMTRSKQETAEERKARKAAQKEFKRSRRTEKKQTKGIFKTETKKQKDLEYQIKHHNPGFKKLL